MQKTTHREGDPDAIRVDRNIPLTWLISVIVVGVVNAAVFYTRMSAQTETIASLAMQVGLLSRQMGEKNASDATRDARLNEHERWLMELRAAVKILESRNQ